MTQSVDVEQWMAVGREEGKRIDSRNAEVTWTYAQVDPYGVLDDIPEEAYCVGRVYRAPVDVIAPKLKSLEAERRSVAEQLAAASDLGKPVVIHPAAIKNYLADVGSMREALDDEKAPERPELITPLRRLIHSVVVHARPGVKGFEVEIKGRLQELLGAPFLKRAVGGGLEVAGERYLRSPRP
jgi:hypothetical protein